MTAVPSIQSLIDRGALFVINHSAGKDSQAMTIVLRRIIPADQLLVIHADLGRVEWAGVQDHIRNTIGDLPLIVCRNENKTLLEMVERRGMWPSPGQRQCTSDLKRGPIEREIRRHLKANPRFEGKRSDAVPGRAAGAARKGLAVNCMGIRAQESPARAKKQQLRFNARNSVAGREWYDWLPIFDLSEAEIFETIAEAGQEPHWAYGVGMSRLSCVFCIMANRQDLQTAARHNPELYREYVRLERRIGHTLSMGRRPLDEVVGIPVDDERRAA